MSPEAHLAQRPQEIFQGRMTRSPGSNSATASPTSTTSATPSCPTGSGPLSGTAPLITTPSMSQVETTSGRTSAAVSAVRLGAGTSRHWSVLAST